VNDRYMDEHASRCQIWWKSVKLRPRYGDFSIFQDGGRRHLGFIKFEFFNGRTVLDGRTASAGQRAKFGQKWSNRGRDMAIFRFFKMAATAILDF